MGWKNVELPPETNINGRMHLTQKQAGELAMILKHFSETGEIKTVDELNNNDDK